MRSHPPPRKRGYSIATPGLVSESRYFCRQNHSFAVVAPDGSMAAIMPLFFVTASSGIGDEQLLTSGFVRHTGPALAAGLSQSACNAARSELFRHTLGLARALRADRVHIGAQTLAPKFRGGFPSLPAWIGDYGFHLGVAVWPGGTSGIPGCSINAADQIVDLDVDEPILFGQLDESCRRAVRKAEKSGLVTVVASDKRSFEVFFELALQSAKRTGETPAPISYLKDIMTHFGSRGEAVVLIVQRETRPIAALVLLVDKGAAHFLAGVSDPLELKLRPNDFAHWSAIRWAKERGLSHYRLGPIFPSVPREWPVAKVSRFKGKFGARSLPMLEASLFLNPGSYADAAHKLVALHCGQTHKQIVRPFWLTRRFGVALIARDRTDPLSAMETAE